MAYIYCMLCYGSLLHWRKEVEMAAESWRTMSMQDILADIDKMPNIAQYKEKLKNGVVSNYLLIPKKYF